MTRRPEPTPAQVSNSHSNVQRDRNQPVVSVPHLSLEAKMSTAFESSRTVVPEEQACSVIPFDIELISGNAWDKADATLYGEEFSENALDEAIAELCGEDFTEISASYEEIKQRCATVLNLPVGGPLDLRCVCVCSRSCIRLFTRYEWEGKVRGGIAGAADLCDFRTDSYEDPAPHLERIKSEVGVHEIAFVEVQWKDFEHYRPSEIRISFAPDIFFVDREKNADFRAWNAIGGEPPGWPASATFQPHRHTNPTALSTDLR